MSSLYSTATVPCDLFILCSVGILDGNCFPLKFELHIFTLCILNSSAQLCKALISQMGNPFINMLNCDPFNPCLHDEINSSNFDKVHNVYISII